MRGWIRAAVVAVIGFSAPAAWAETLADALAEHGYAESQVATAVNAEFVPKGQRGTRKLADGDRVEVVVPRQGG